MFVEIDVRPSSAVLDVASKVREALTPMMRQGTVTGFRFRRIADTARDTTGPSLTVVVAGESPEKHMLQISRVLILAGLTELPWAIQPATEADESYGGQPEQTPGTDRLLPKWSYIPAYVGREGMHSAEGRSRAGSASM